MKPAIKITLGVVFCSVIVVFGYYMYSSRILSISVHGLAVDQNYPKRYEDSIAPQYNEFAIYANYQKENELQEQVELSGPLYKVAAFDENDNLIEERKAGYLFKDQTLRQCMADIKCTSPVIGEFHLSLAYSKKIKKIKLFKDDMLLTESEVVSYENRRKDIFK